MKFLVKRIPKMTTTPIDLPLTDVKIFTTFDEMDLPTNLLRGIYAHGFEKPSEIQKRGIVPIKNGNDLLAQAQSGTGKTGTFCVGALTKIDPSLMKPQVLVIVPTRELAQQIEKVAQALGSYMELKTYSATGGTPIRDDLRALERGLHFIVGTPGRIFDLMNRGQLNRQYIRVLVLDEADQMLEDRFKEQILCILQMGFPKQTQVALFSATMPAEVVEVANKLLREPVRILIPPEEVTLEGISQYCVMLQKEEWKFDALCDIYKQLTVNQAIIYCNKRQRAEWLAEKMIAEGFPLSYIHGEMDVEERRNRMQAFRSGNVRVLISTDLLARGIDVQQVSLVINFELPPQRENYIHRIGRSGRYGRKGTAINLISGDEVNAMKDIESHYQTIIKELPDDLANLIKN
jgi:translation initiation factor 4A